MKPAKSHLTARITVWAMLASLVPVLAMSRPQSSVLGAGTVWAGTVAASSTSPAYNYAEALQKALVFYEAQRSGNVTPRNTRLEWRGPSHLHDGSAAGVDLSGGLYDAGDVPKWPDTMAFAATTLAWSGVVYRNGYLSSGQMPYLKSNLRWLTEFMLRGFRCGDINNPATYVIYVEISDVNQDHGYWAADEVMELLNPNRPVYYADKDAPAVNFVADAAASLAAASVVFHQNGEPEYAALLRGRAAALYRFAKAYRESPNAHKKWKQSAGTAPTMVDLNDSGHFEGDPASKLCWAALWLHQATTGAKTASPAGYLDDAMGYAARLDANGYGYNDYSLGDYILLAKLSGKASYKTAIEKKLDTWVSTPRTPGGLAKIGTPGDYGKLRNVNNAAFPTFVYADSGLAAPEKARAYTAWAQSQLDYALGSNPSERSYEMGFQPPGKSVVRSIHHRTAQGVWAGFEHLISNRPEFSLVARHTLYGALIGGPNWDDEFIEDNAPQQHEVALDFQSGFTGNLARMTDRLNLRQGARDWKGNQPPNEARDNYDDREFFVDAAVLQQGRGFVEIKAQINNRSRWPARDKSTLSFRYYFTPQPGRLLNATLLANDGATLTGPIPAGHNLAYFTFDFHGQHIGPLGLDAKQGYRHLERRTVAFRLQGSETWDPRGDWSCYGLRRGPLARTAYLPVFDNAQLIGGATPATNARQIGIPLPPAHPFLVVSGYTPPASSSGPVDLTGEGEQDWSHWSRTYTVQNRKASGGHQISDITRIPAGLQVGRFSETGGGTVWSWSDGVAEGKDWVAREPGTDAGTWITGLGHGVQITAPADATPRTLRLYVGVLNCEGTLTARLADNSAPPVRITLSKWLVSGGAHTASRVLTLSYRSNGKAVDAQGLIVTWTMTCEDPNRNFSRIEWNAATLSQGYTPGPLNLGYAPNAPGRYTKPETPVVSATVVAGRVRLRWNPVPGAEYYTIKRSTTAGGPYAPIPQIGSTTSYPSSYSLDADRYVDLNASAGTRYYYVVVANNRAGGSDNSPEVSVQL